MRASAKTALAHNAEMKLGALFGWGIVIYAVLFLVSAAMSVHGVQNTLLSRGVIFVTLVVTASIAARSLRLYSERDVALYAGGWVVCAILLDTIMVVPAYGWSLFADANVWVGYIVLFFVPVIAHMVSRRAAQ